MYLEPADAWLATVGQLELQLHQNTYETWIKDTEFVAYEKGTFIIGVRNDYAKDWLEQRLCRVILRTLNMVYGDDVSVKYVTKAPATAQPTSFGPLLDAKPPIVQERATPPQKASLIAPVIEKKPAVHFAQGQVINPDYSIDDVVIGKPNDMVLAGIRAICTAPGKVFNPLFIYGDVGLGKTHLLHGIANHYQSEGKKVLLVSGETFTNDIIRAIRTQHTEQFRTFYREVDVLLVDDVQFIAGKESTQEEFFHTFNAIHSRGGQIVLTASRRPTEIDDLDKRLASRFEAGLAVRLNAPDMDTRKSILKLKAAAQDTDLSDDIAEMIAYQATGNVRELEGVLNKVLAKAAMLRQPLCADSVAEALGQHRKTAPKPELDLKSILEATAQYHQLTLDDLLSKQRNQQVSMARHVAIYLAREEIQATLPAIGRALGGRTHSTVLNGYRKIAKRVDNDPAFRKQVKALRDHLYQLA